MSELAARQYISPARLAASQNAVVCTRSSKYYFDDGSHVFCVENTLYRLHKGLLASKLDVFDGMFTLPASGLGAEGSSDAYPIYPPQVTRQEWEYLLQYIYGIWSKPPYDAEYLLAVLKVSGQWEMNGGKEWAIHHLNQIRYKIPPARRLEIAREYDINDWMRPALVSLVRSPLKYLLPDDYVHMGTQTFQVVARLREAFETLRKMLGMPPDIKDIMSLECDASKHVQCIRVWQDTWTKKIWKPLLHYVPESALELHEVRGVIEGLELSSMTPDCRELAVHMALQSDLLGKEEELISQGLNSLTAHTKAATAMATEE